MAVDQTQTAVIGVAALGLGGWLLFQNKPERPRNPDDPDKGGNTVEDQRQYYINKLNTAFPDCGVTTLAGSSFVAGSDGYANYLTAYNNCYRAYLTSLLNEQFGYTGTVTGSDTATIYGNYKAIYDMYVHGEFGPAAAVEAPRAFLGVTPEVWRTIGIGALVGVGLVAMQKTYRVGRY